MEEVAYDMYHGYNLNKDKKKTAIYVGPNLVSQFIKRSFRDPAVTSNAVYIKQSRIILSPNCSTTSDSTTKQNKKHSSSSVAAP